ncbi:SDR family oxidoreductase [Antrihabitans sp. YC2-6]|uniref:SDR family NAD(P)-dependent oxidoreductase n=1 Tax=Antrihabitans sp. YC2-6 TaxID=2799498 RepID=UPI0018F79A3E|nr:SDR family oxidoreductase [Antrihabitans sp. YC2-6]MBJ8347909.1 SDR family oxidoreductase [Antrihabitans sp. YC2-6]
MRTDVAVDSVAARADIGEHEKSAERVALVTGATGGIGPDIARALAAQGVHLAISGRREDVLETLAKQLRATGVRVAPIPADLADFDQIDPLVDRSEDALGPIDILVNNAGVENVARYADLTRAELQAMIDINLTSPMLLTHRVLPGMERRGDGHVVFVGSLNGKRGLAYTGPYAATKAGLSLLTQSLRDEYRQTQIGFSAVCPGFVLGGGMYQRLLDQGLRAPGMLGSTTTERVAAKVVKVIKRDLPEGYVNTPPMRPTLVLAEMAPKFVERLLPIFGGGEFFRQVGAKRQADADVVS